MNEVMLFSNPEFGSVRTVMIDNEVWFVGNDVAKALGYSRANEAIRNNTNKEDTVVTGVSDANNHIQQMVVINESGLYDMIFESRLQKAKDFRRWVTYEVLPAIRKKGEYSVKVKKTDSYLIEDPIARAERWIEEQKEKRLLEEKNQYLEETVEEQRPKAEYFDALVDDNLLTNFRDTAKELGLSQTEFVGWLLDKEYVYKDSHGIIKPYEPYRKRGLFAMKDFMNPNSGFTGVRTYVTVKGKNTFRLLLQIP